MANRGTNDPGQRRVPPSQSINGPVIGGSGGLTGNNIIGDVAIYEARIQDLVDRINSNADPDEQMEEFSKSTEIGERLAILCKVRADKAANLVTKLMKPELPGRTVALLERIDDSRMIELLGPGGLRPQDSTRILAVLSVKRVRSLLKLLGTDKPELAAGLVERLAGMQANPNTRAGLRGSIDVLPRDREDRRFLTRLSDSQDAIKLLEALEQLRPDVLRDLLMDLPQTELSRRLRQVPKFILTALAGVDQTTPAVNHVVQDLDLLDSAWIASVLSELGPGLSAQWMDSMQSDQVAAALNHMQFVLAAAPLLERMDHDRAALVLERMKPDRAAACLEHVRIGIALELLQRLSIADTEWLSLVLKGMDSRLVAALLTLLAWTAMDHHNDAATRLHKALGASRTPASAGWPHLSAILMMRTIAGPAAQILSRRVRSTRPLGLALHRAARDARSLWQRLLHVAGPPDYRRQRNHLAIALALTLVVLVGVITGGAGR